MKPGALLVNTSRGGVVDRSAMTAALETGQLAAAGLDVFDAEPVDPANPLLALDNVVDMWSGSPGTPCPGIWPRRSTIADGCRDGREPVNVVNGPESVDAPSR